MSFEKRSVQNVSDEMKRFNAAVSESKSELQAIREHAMKALGADKAAIFDAHLLVLEDPELLMPVQDKIRDDQVNAEYAL
ncbi:phosphoenolpyruvate--protein phosphotransferase, partial [Anaerostipes hadrus]|nr:phosphoenolpyruvate--protein phosphotransferase [Anaerostipes hadrus]